MDCCGEESLDNYNISEQATKGTKSAKEEIYFLRFLWLQIRFPEIEHQSI